MHREHLATLVIGGMALVAVAAGLWLVGGPGSGKVEHRDRARMVDLRELGPYVACLADLNDGTLPQALAPEPACGENLRFSDPYTDAPYLYRIDFETDTRARYSLCADFEAPDRLTDSYLPRGSFDPDTGCAAFAYKP